MIIRKDHRGNPVFNELEVMVLRATLGEVERPRYNRLDPF